LTGGVGFSLTPINYNSYIAACESFVFQKFNIVLRFYSCELRCFGWRGIPLM